MELKLGLGFSNFSHKVPVLKELDLISHINGDAKHVYDDHDHDDSALSSQSSVNSDDDGGICMTKKRGFGDAFEVESSVSYVCKTLPLLLWDEEPNEQERKAKRICQCSSFSIAKNYYEDAIVGWPPIKSHRKKLHHQKDAHHCNRRPRGKFAVVENGGSCGGSQSMFVKVQMEGCGITRKIDLRLYHSYESLMYCLFTMFGKGTDSVDGYKLTYQDREGDWLLAGDLPWRTFIGSVQRFKLMKKED